MKKFIMLAFAASALLAGCCTKHHTVRWEYKVVPPPFPTAGTTTEGWREQQQAFLNNLGQDGWVFISQDNANFYFKRPVK